VLRNIGLYRIEKYFEWNLNNYVPACRLIGNLFDFYNDCYKVCLNLLYISNSFIGRMRQNRIIPHPTATQAPAPSLLFPNINLYWRLLFRLGADKYWSSQSMGCHILEVRASNLSLETWYRDSDVLWCLSSPNLVLRTGHQIGRRASFYKEGRMYEVLLLNFGPQNDYCLWRFCRFSFVLRENAGFVAQIEMPH